MVLDTNQLVEIITEKINTIVVITNPFGETVYVSQSVKRILGYEADELMGSQWWQVTRQDDSAASEMLHLFRESVKQKCLDELSTERMLLSKNNQPKWISWNTSFDGNGNVISVGYDITNRKKNEKKLARSVNLLKNKNKEITDSLNYARSIQQSILPNKDVLKPFFKQAGIYYQPKDIVSGDFYFIYEFEERLYIACIDCTGHGVPGALMTILANNLLKNVIKHQQITEPSMILHALDALLYDEFNNNKSVKRSDGMDISLVVLDYKNRVLQFAGAHHSLIYRTKNSGDLVELKGNRYPIGLFHDVQKVFETYVILYSPGDSFYLFTDGITDQFGGDKDKKFTKKRVLDLLHSETENGKIEMLLNQHMENWRGGKEQTDDMLFMFFEL